MSLTAGQKLTCTKRHLVDHDDNDEERWIEEGESAEIISVDSVQLRPLYHVGVPSSGATGFYSTNELNRHFEIQQATEQPSAT